MSALNTAAAFFTRLAVKALPKFGTTIAIAKASSVIAMTNSTSEKPRRGTLREFRCNTGESSPFHRSRLERREGWLRTLMIRNTWT